MGTSANAFSLEEEGHDLRTALSFALVLWAAASFTDDFTASPFTDQTRCQPIPLCRQRIWDRRRRGSHWVPYSVLVIVDIERARSAWQESFLCDSVSMKHFLWDTFIYISSFNPLDDPS